MAVFSMRASVTLGNSDQSDFTKVYGVLVPSRYEPTHDDMLRYAGLIADRYIENGNVCVSDITALGCDVSVISIMLDQGFVESKQAA